jgi:excisionase family DNA binding protein
MALGEIPGIYAVFCKATGLPYIGSSVNVYAHTFSHVTALRRGRHQSHKLMHAWKTYGENSFDIVILEFCPKESLQEREQHYIDAWDAYNSGYNGDPGPLKQNQKRVSRPVKFEKLDINNKKKLLTVNEFAKIVDIAPKTIYRLASDGKIPCIRIGRNIRFSHDMINQIKGASN